MGLDMYIIAKQKGQPKTDPDTGYALGKEAAYWRKAWIIRTWLENHKIIDGNDNCRSRPISRSQMAMLKRECDVLINIKDDVRFCEDLAECYGFTNCSEHYSITHEDISDLVEELEETSGQLANLLYEYGQEYEFIYYDSWLMYEYHGLIILDSTKVFTLIP